MKKLLLFLFLIPVVLFAQDTTIVFPRPDVFPTSGGPVDYLLWVYNNLAEIAGYFVALLVAVEALLRALSTKVNISPLQKIVEFLDRLANSGFFPKNKRMGGGSFVARTGVVVNKDLEIGDVVFTDTGVELKITKIATDGTIYAK